MDNAEGDEVSAYIAKLGHVKAIAVGWHALYDASQKTDKKLTIEEAKAESSERQFDVASILQTMSHAELVSAATHLLFEQSRKNWVSETLRGQAKLVLEQREMIRQRLQAVKKRASERGSKAADVRHGQPGGTRDKADEMRRIWASGKYSSRDVCAEQECAALGVSFSTARKALRGTPDPTK